MTGTLVLLRALRAVREWAEERTRERSDAARLERLVEGEEAP